MDTETASRQLPNEHLLNTQEKGRLLGIDLVHSCPSSDKLQTGTILPMNRIFTISIFLCLVMIPLVVGCSGDMNSDVDGGDSGDGCDSCDGGEIGDNGDNGDSGDNGDIGDNGDSVDGGDSGECEFEWAPDAQSGAVVVEIEDRNLYNAHVIRDGCGMTMWAEAIKPHDFQVHRFESGDGFHWSEGTPITFDSGDIPGGSPYVLKNQEGNYVMWYVTGEDMNKPVGTKNEVGMATSFDGIEWQDDGIVYSGSGQEADNLLMDNPTVWYDGEQYHLIYTGWRDYLVSDVGIKLFSILHAKSVDGTNFEFNSILFQSEACQGGTPYEFSQWRVQDIIRSPDPECPSVDIAYLLIWGKQCLQDWQLFTIRLSSEGLTGDLTPIAATMIANASSMLIGRDLWLYSHQEDNTGRYGIIIEKMELPGDVDLNCP